MSIDDQANTGEVEKALAAADFWKAQIAMTPHKMVGVGIRELVVLADAYRAMVAPATRLDEKSKDDQDA